MKAMLRTVNDHGVFYECLAFWCPGCALNCHTGIHMLPVNTSVKLPQWSWDGNIEEPTLSPSILSSTAPFDENGKPLGRCHSFLKNGMFEFLGDCTHAFAGQTVPAGDLPDWFIEENHASA